MVDAFHLWMVLQKVDHLQSVRDMALHSERQRFEPLQEKECVERAEGGTGIPEQGDSCLDDIGRRSRSFRKSDAVIARIRLR
jgi:hypothetical protein